MRGGEGGRRGGRRCALSRPMSCTHAPPSPLASSSSSSPLQACRHAEGLMYHERSAADHRLNTLNTLQLSTCTQHTFYFESSVSYHQSKPLVSAAFYFGKEKACVDRGASSVVSLQDDILYPQNIQEPPHAALSQQNSVSRMKRAIRVSSAQKCDICTTCLSRQRQQHTCVTSPHLTSAGTLALQHQ